MKKLLFTLALAGVSVAGMAQNNETSVPEMKYSVATNSFWSNWFVQANVAGTAFYSNEEQGWDLSNSPFKGFRNNLGFSVAIGKWFTPGLGLRTKFNGVWGRTVGADAKGEAWSKDENANKYWTLNEQVLFNLSNMFCGYSNTRVWNFIPYVGAGVGRNMSANTYAMGLSAGILNTFRLSDRFALNFELGYSLWETDMDGIHSGAIESKHGPASRDQMFNVEVGLTYNVGKTRWNKTPDVDALKALSQSQIDALNAQLADSQNENAKLKDMLANQKPVETTKIVKEIAAAPVSVFFNIGKSRIASKKDLQNVKDLVEVAKANNSKIVVTGYADSKTGSSAFNQKLSQKRADVVANELVNMGVSRDNIEVVAAGGVNTLSPVSYNRRATVTIK
ncbi:MAG: OmpA family protein [Prevotella sp.]|nr:OmpA family protein [Prevotella sp.]MDE6355140.1 OmpA family protein [Prevotella sp.]